VKLVDANIVIYSLGREHRYRKLCRAIIDQMAVRPYDYSIDAEMLQEILYVFWKRGAIDTGTEVVRQLLGLVPEVIPVGGPEAAAAARSLERPSRLSVRDAIHAAVVFEHDLDGIISAGRGFDSVSVLRHFDPREVADGC